jgi:hypothetical protein
LLCNTNRINNIKSNYIIIISYNTGIIADDNDIITFNVVNSVGIAEQTAKKELIRTTDLLGRETKRIKNKSLLYIYNDGTVEKKVVIE